MTILVATITLAVVTALYGVHDSDGDKINFNYVDGSDGNEIETDAKTVLSSTSFNLVIKCY